MTSPAEYLRKFLTPASALSADFQAAVDNHRQAVAQHRDNTNNYIERTTSRPELSRQAKQAHAAAKFREAQATAAQARADLDASINKRRSSLYNRGLGWKPSTDPQVTALRRQATETAAGIDNPGIAQEMLSQAHQNGDTILAQAIAARAYTYGWRGLVDEWGASNQANIAAIKEMESLPDTNDRLWKMQSAAEHHIATPAILDGLRDWEINALARGDVMSSDGPEAA